MPLWWIIFVAIAASIAGSIIGTLAVLGMFLLIMHNSKGNRQRR